LEKLKTGRKKLLFLWEPSDINLVGLPISDSKQQGVVANKCYKLPHLINNSAFVS
jgi:hypothetical protein